MFYPCSCDMWDFNYNRQLVFRALYGLFTSEILKIYI